MNFDQAIIAHSDWKRKLKSYLSKPDQSLKVAEVSASDKCQLGQWIAGEGRKLYVALPDFAKLSAEHIRFHKAAAELVRKADSGQTVDSEVALGANSEFAKATLGVVSAIVEMKKKA